MEVGEAVKRAKAYIGQVFADEPVSELRLEEVEFDDASNCWLVTISVLRPTTHGSTFADLALGEQPLKRTYKLVRLADDGSGVPSIKVRSFALDEP